MYKGRIPAPQAEESSPMSHFSHPGSTSRVRQDGQNSTFGRFLPSSLRRCGNRIASNKFVRRYQPHFGLFATWSLTSPNSRHVRAIPWPSERWRARRRIEGGGVGRGRGADAATAAATARRRGATPTGGAVTPPRSAPTRGGRGGPHGAREGGWDRPPRDGPPLTAPLDGVHVVIENHASLPEF